MGDELISLGERIGDKEKVFAGYDHGLHCVWALADRAAVDVRVQALGELADELRQPPHHWDVGTTRAMVALMEGRFDDAEHADRRHVRRSASGPRAGTPPSPTGSRCSSSAAPRVASPRSRS